MIPPERYTAFDFHRQEVEKVWKRTWQVACRENVIHTVGDHFIYGVAGLSFIIVRTAEKQFKCGYHSCTWNIDGSLAFYPGKWDFPDVDPAQYFLRQVQVGT